MNLPNKLTLMRIILVPVFLVCMYVAFPYRYLCALLVFAAASITDALDGQIARKRNLVTTFGKFADPLADKILVLAAFAALADIAGSPVNGIVVTIIAAREFMVSGLRLVTAEKGVVVAAGIWGKLKTAFTMVAIVLMLVWAAYREIAFIINPPQIIGGADWSIQSKLMFAGAAYWVFFVLVWISVLLTVISGAVYLKGYWKYIDLK